MLKYFYYTLGIIVGALHVSFFSNITFFNLEISIALIALVALVLLKSGKDAYQFALTAGIMIDIFSPSPFGLNLSLFLTLVFVYEIVLKKFFEKTSFIARISLMFGAVISIFVLRYVFLHVFFEINIIPFEPDISLHGIFFITGSAVINTVLLLLATWIFSFFDEVVQKRIYQRSRYVS